MSSAESNAGHQPLPPNVRRRLQMQFDAANKATNSGNFKYATDMFIEVLKVDPGNHLYVGSFLAMLHKSFNNNKTGVTMAAMRSAKTRGVVKKCELAKDWRGVLTNGLTLLTFNPWDTSALAAMAGACDALSYDEAELTYLKSALDVEARDPEVNRLYGRALGRQGRFDEAIVAWNRVLAGRPNDDEARRAVSNLTVQRTIHKGGYEEAKSSTDVMSDKLAQKDRQGLGGTKLSPEQQFLKAIAKKPEDLDNYIELFNIYLKDERYEEAEPLLEKALEVSGGDVGMRERLEDVRIRRARHQVTIAEQKAREEKTPESEQLWKQMVKELNQRELEVYRSRSERYPGHLGFKYELALRLQRAGNYNEAIELYQEARADSKRRGAVLLALGECFCAIKQYKLGLSNLEAAIEEISDRDLDLKKHALYQTGRLALGLKDLDKADKYLTELAGLQFGYKDVGRLLDKLNELRNSG